MWCEDDLVGEFKGDFEKRVFHDEVLEKSRMFREALADSLSPEEATAAAINDVVTAKRTWFMSIDNRCRVELAFWTSSIGDEARERVHACILSCLASNENDLTISQSSQKFEQMQKKKILIFAGMGMQSQFDTIHGFVKSLKAGLCPAVGKAGDSSFMQQVTIGPSLFLMYKQGDSFLSGHAAAKAMMQDIANAHDADLTKVKYDEVATLLCFSWLLEPSQLTKLRAIQNRLGANKVGQLTAAAKTKAKKGAQSAAESKQTLAALFSRE
jgi:hypothetical protein